MKSLLKEPYKIWSNLHLNLGKFKNTSLKEEIIIKMTMLKALFLIQNQVFNKIFSSSFYKINYLYFKKKTLQKIWTILKHNHLLLWLKGIEKVNLVSTKYLMRNRLNKLSLEVHLENFLKKIILKKYNKIKTFHTWKKFKIMLLFYPKMMEIYSIIIHWSVKKRKNTQRTIESKTQNNM